MFQYFLTARQSTAQILQIFWLSRFGIFIWLNLSLLPRVLNYLHQFQNQQRDSTQCDHQEAIDKWHIRCLEESAQSRVVPAPHLEAKRNGNHDNEVDVREKGDAPNRLGFAAGVTPILVSMLLP